MNIYIFLISDLTNMYIKGASYSGVRSLKFCHNKLYIANCAETLILDQ